MPFTWSNIWPGGKPFYTPAQTTNTQIGNPSTGSHLLHPDAAKRQDEKNAAMQALIEENSNQLGTITNTGQVNKMSMFPDMSNVNWRGNIFQGDARGYGNTGVTSVFNPNNMPAMVGRTNWTPDNIIEETETETIYPASNDLDANWDLKLRMQDQDTDKGILNALRTGGSQIKDFALGATSKIPFVGPAIDFIGDQFEYRPAGIYTDEEGNVYNPEALDKMNARGGWYTEPARASRRRDARITNMLERQRLGKRISDNNLARLQEQQKQQEAARVAATKSLAAANRATYGTDKATGGYQSSFGGDTGFMSGSGTAADMGSFKQGGRVGLYAGGDPEEVQEDLNIYQFMQDQGVPYGDQASAVDPMDALNDMSMDIFGKPLHELTGEEYQMLIDLANDQASGPQEEIVEEGIASLV